MNSAFTAALFAAVSSATIDVDELKFINFLSKFGKHYESMEEFVERKEVFLVKD